MAMYVIPAFPKIEFLINYLALHSSSPCKDGSTSTQQLLRWNWAYGNSQKHAKILPFETLKIRGKSEERDRRATEELKYLEKPNRNDMKIRKVKGMAWRPRICAKAWPIHPHWNQRTVEQTLQKGHSIIQKGNWKIQKNWNWLTRANGSRMKCGAVRSTKTCQN